MIATKVAKVAKKDNVAALLDKALDAGEGLLRLTPTWVPRSFLQPGQRHQARTRATSTPTAPTAAASTSAGSPAPPKPPTKTACRTKGSSYVVVRRQAVHARATPSPKPGDRLIGKAMFEEVQDAGRSTRSSSTTWGRSRTTCTRAPSSAKLVGQEGKPESYYFPPQHNNVDNNFCLHVHGPRAGHDQGRRSASCLENWNKGDNGILDLSQAYRLKPRHRLADSARRPARPGLALHLRAAVGQRRVRHVPDRSSKAAYVPWSLLVKDMPKEKHQDLDFIIEPARLGEERRSALQGEQLPRADRRHDGRAATATSTSGSSTARSTASSSSAPRS